MSRKRKTLYSDNPPRRVSDVDPARAKRQIMHFIVRFSAERGYSPSVREITAQVGLLSTSTTHKYLGELITEGRLERDTKLSRTLRIIA